MRPRPWRIAPACAGSDCFPRRESWTGRRGPACRSRERRKSFCCTCQTHTCCPTPQPLPAGLPPRRSIAADVCSADARAVEGCGVSPPRAPAPALTNRDALRWVFWSTRSRFFHSPHECVSTTPSFPRLDRRPRRFPNSVGYRGVSPPGVLAPLLPTPPTNSVAIRRGFCCRRIVPRRRRHGLHDRCAR